MASHLFGACQDCVFREFGHIERKRVIDDDSSYKTPQGNFGGDTGWYGAIPDINDSLDAAQKYPNSTLVGTAIVPEGLFQNEFVYDYTLQLGKMALQSNINFDHSIFKDTMVKWIPRLRISFDSGFEVDIIWQKSTRFVLTYPFFSLVGFSTNEILEIYLST